MRRPKKKKGKHPKSAKPEKKGKPKAKGFSFGLEEVESTPLPASPLPPAEPERLPLSVTYNTAEVVTALYFLLRYYIKRSTFHRTEQQWIDVISKAFAEMRKRNGDKQVCDLMALAVSNISASLKPTDEKGQLRYAMEEIGKVKGTTKPKKQKKEKRRTAFAF